MFVQYDGDSYVLIELTDGKYRFRAIQTDGRGEGVGNTPLESVLSLCENMRQEANKIEDQARIQLPADPPKSR